MKIMAYVILLCLTFTSSTLAHEVHDEEKYRPNQPFIDCKKGNSEKICKDKYPIFHRQIIPSKYLEVYVASNTSLCFDISKLISKQSKVTLDTIIGETGIYTTNLDMSYEERKKLKRIVKIHIHRNKQTKMCANGNGFVVEVGTDFIDIWTSAKERDRNPFIGRDIWVAYKHGDWK